MKSTVTFKKYFYESITSSALGSSADGFSPENISGSDFYAPGDARIPKGSAVYTRKGLIKRKKNKKRKSKNKK